MTTTRQPDTWEDLRAWTEARLALGRAGISQPTRAHLAFQLDHARARDAVWTALDTDALCHALGPLPFPPLVVGSLAPDRLTYLQRPDLGRQLDDQAITILGSHGGQHADVVFVIADGLSARAVQEGAPALVRRLHERCAVQGWRVAPPVIVRQGRVAVGDAIGGLLGARLSVLMIGERPGLSSPHSMGAYLTFAPVPGRTDAERNCVSNIRPGGLTTEDAAGRLDYLMRESLRRGLSGVSLKDAYEPMPMKPPV